MADYSRIRCSICKGKLIIGADLRCDQCRIVYPIKNGIPVMLTDRGNMDHEQNLAVEKEFYENMFSGLKGFEDGHCIVYGYERIYEFMKDVERGTLLEAGCGAGHHSVNLTKRGLNPKTYFHKIPF